MVFMRVGFSFRCGRDHAVHHGLDVSGRLGRGDAYIGALRGGGWGIIFGGYAEIQDVVAVDVFAQTGQRVDQIHGYIGGDRLLQDGLSGEGHQFHDGEVVAHLLEGFLDHQGLAVDAVIVGVNVADADEIHGGLAIHLVKSLCEVRQPAECSVNRFIQLDFYTADLVDQAGDAGEIDNAVVVDGDVEVIGNGLRQHFHAGTAPGEVLSITVSRINAPVGDAILTQPGDGQPEVARDGEHDDLLLNKVQAHQADHIGLGVFVHAQSPEGSFVPVPHISAELQRDQRRTYRPDLMQL